MKYGQMVDYYESRNKKPAVARILDISGNGPAETGFFKTLDLAVGQDEKTVKGVPHFVDGEKGGHFWFGMGKELPKEQPKPTPEPEPTPEPAPKAKK